MNSLSQAFLTISLRDSDMGDFTKIEWADKTFNPWIGCQKVSPGCDNCYAEAMMDKRYGKVEWGPHGERKRTSVENWRKPRRWARNCQFTGKRERVFCASLADVFDNQVPAEWRGDLFDLIAGTPELDWLLLTKRPENLCRMWPPGDWWPNIWLGVTCEDQAHYNRRWPLLAEQTNVPVRFISYEPALGALEPCPVALSSGLHYPDWIICGGESGYRARPMHQQWACTLRDECQALDIPFFFKQWGEWGTFAGGLGETFLAKAHTCRWVALDGRWSTKENHDPGPCIVAPVGKKVAGRRLDGREWSEFPSTSAKVI
jgi:protein gp37